MGGYSIQTGLGKKQGDPSAFSEDGFHPGAAGIARQKNALLAQPSAATAQSSPQSSPQSSFKPSTAPDKGQRPFRGAALGLFGENPAKRIKANGLSKKISLKDIPKGFLALFKNLPKGFKPTQKEIKIYYLAYTLQAPEKRLPFAEIARHMLLLGGKVEGLESQYGITFDREALFSSALVHLINGNEGAIAALCGELEAAGYDLEAQKLSVKQAGLKAKADILRLKIKEKKSKRNQLHEKIAGLVNANLSLWTYGNHDDASLRGEVEALSAQTRELTAEIDVLVKEEKALEEALLPGYREDTLLQYKALESLGVAEEKLNGFLAELGLSKDAVPEKLKDKVALAKQAVEAQASVGSVEQVLYSKPAEALRRAVSDYQATPANQQLLKVFAQFESLEKQYGIGDIDNS